MYKHNEMIVLFEARAQNLATLFATLASPNLSLPVTSQLRNYTINVQLCNSCIHPARR